MRAIVSTSNGPELQDVPRPSPRAEEVLVHVRASALNRADLAMLKGAGHGGVGGMGTPLGLEWAGEVVEVGPAVSAWRVGDRVMAAGGNAFAEYAVGHARRIYAMPERLSFEEGAGLPVALQTMHDAIATHGMLAPGQSVLFQGASSGVGLMGQQVAKLLGAAVVIGSSTSPERRARLRDFGADHAIDTRAADWVKHVQDATGGKRVDLIVDMLAGPIMNENMKATRIGGRIVNVGRLAGLSGEMDFNLHALRRISYVGVTFRTRSAGEVEEIVAKTARALLPAVATGGLRIPIDKTYPLEAATEAFAHMAANKHFGKIVLTHKGE